MAVWILAGPGGDVNRWSDRVVQTAAYPSCGAGMTDRIPPKLATLLVNSLVPANEALVGDLVEGFEHGGSRAWYWRQALSAILVTFVHDVRAHKLLTVRGLVVGWFSAWVLFDFVRYPVFAFDQWLMETGLFPWFWHNGIHFPFSPYGWQPVSICSAMSAWTVGRFHRPAIVLAFIVSAVLFPWVHLLWLLWLGRFEGSVLGLLHGVFLVEGLPMLVVGLWAAARPAARRVRGA
jgi:hypothetical protein